MPSKYNSSVVSRSPSKASRALVPSSNRQEVALAPSMPRLTHAQGAWVPVGEVAYFMPCHDRYCHEAYYNGGHWKYYTQEKFMTFDEIASLSQRQDFRNTIESSKPQGYIVEDITDKASLVAEDAKRQKLYESQVDQDSGNKLLDRDFGGINDNSPSVSQVGSESGNSAIIIANLQNKLAALSKQNSVVGSDVSKMSSGSQAKIAQLQKQLALATAQGSVVGSDTSKMSSNSQAIIAQLQRQLLEANAQGSVVGSDTSKMSSSSQAIIAQLQQQIEQAKSSGVSAAPSGYSAASQATIDSLQNDILKMQLKKKARVDKAGGGLQKQALYNASQQKPKRRIEDLGVDVSTNSRDKMFKQEDGTASVVSRASKTSGMSHISGLTGLTGLGKDENQIG